MKKLTHSIPAKVIAIILFLLFTVGAITSLFTCFFIAGEGYFTGNITDMYKTERCKNLTAGYAEQVYNYYCMLRDFREEHPDLPTPAAGEYDNIGKYQNSTLALLSREFSDSNFRFSVYTESGEELFGTYAKQPYGYRASYDYVYTYSANERLSVDEYGDEYYDYDTYSETVIIQCYVLDPLIYDDAYSDYREQFELLYKNRFNILALTGVCMLCSIACFVFLMCAAGKRKNTQGIVLNLQDKLPLDLYLAIAALICLPFFKELLYVSFSRLSDIVYTLVLIAPILIVFLLLTMTLATRLKSGAFWKNTLLYRIGRGCASLLRTVPFIWKGAVALLLFFIVEVIFYLCALWYVKIAAPLCIGFHIGIFVLAIVILTNLSRLKTGGERLAQGDLSYTMDKQGLFGPFKEHAENLNSISDGMTKAIELRMQSERMKTELITNVSHDIKTPLTSIINYVDLLKKEQLDGKKANEYLDVLDRQSARLKKLIVDLVEASKASTGSITAEPVPTDVGEMLSQAVAEYQARFQQAGLEVIMNCDEKLRILADGRLLWRVLDNLLGNVCKYSKSGTRVYIDALPHETHCSITVKNISGSALNIDPEELMERFVRGDTARTTEGSGLGLSIARSLTELQNGTLNLFIDGDLFKVELKLPLI